MCAPITQKLHWFVMSAPSRCTEDKLWMLHKKLNDVHAFVQAVITCFAFISQPYSHDLFWFAVAKQDLREDISNFNQ